MMNGKKVKPQRGPEKTQRYTKVFPRVSLWLFVYLCGLTLKAQDFEAAMAKQGLVDIQKVDPAILVELKYSTTDNFVGKDVYGDLTRAFMQPMAAKKLAAASKYLQAHHPNLRLLVYDAARPRSAQWKLWNALPELPENERQKYVADPRKGSIHNYGCAVDLTVATADGKALDMGTKYDFFGELAYPSREKELLQTGKLTQQQIDNRQILRTAMRQGGFSPIEFEWWHFNALSREKAKMAFRIVD
ncbi:M15 family metallopeptidase [Spirosoma linguale]|uniref:D-alanyl-D-alanine dipeptidase n=1 Tax=Spirosoma linguale (strain ATCC 33905 / DSM 74 / LMG 10896 / Claus 1) TaxID=504472 RepID=D2QMM8_SPILD|nr:peptidase M15D vanX D-ala-D-ala dipeptidase [Spirosoma linguale DSM 74]